MDRQARLASWVLNHQLSGLSGWVFFRPCQLLKVSGPSCYWLSRRIHQNNKYLDQLAVLATAEQGHWGDWELWCQLIIILISYQHNHPCSSSCCTATSASTEEWLFLVIIEIGRVKEKEREREILQTIQPWPLRQQTLSKGSEGETDCHYRQCSGALAPDTWQLISFQEAVKDSFLPRLRWIKKKQLLKRRTAGNRQQMKSSRWFLSSNIEIVSGFAGLLNVVQNPSQYLLHCILLLHALLSSCYQYLPVFVQLKVCLFHLQFLPNWIPQVWITRLKFCNIIPSKSFRLERSEKTFIFFQKMWSEWGLSFTPVCFMPPSDSSEFYLPFLSQVAKLVMLWLTPPSRGTVIPAQGSYTDSAIISTQ